MAENRAVIGGVDTHGKTHHAAVVDEVGRIVGSEAFEANAPGYKRLLGWMRRLGTVRAVGVEGTGSYGAGLCNYLLSEGICVVEVDRPDRKTRRQSGKSDPIDAEAAARAVLAGTARAMPKDRAGLVESIRVLRSARAGALKAETAAINCLRSTIVTAPEELRASLAGLSKIRLIKTCAQLRPRMERIDEPFQGTKQALRSLARRILALRDEINEADRQLLLLIARAAPRTLAIFAVGTEAAGQLLVTAGTNPERLRSEASFAHLCGVAPVPASSGNTRRHRLHRGGDRAANRALYHVALVRMRYCARTQAYVAKRTAQGLSKKDVIRCLKRYIAREVFSALKKDMRALNAA